MQRRVVGINFFMGVCMFTIDGWRVVKYRENSRKISKHYHIYGYYILPKCWWSPKNCCGYLKFWFWQKLFKIKYLHYSLWQNQKLTLSGDGPTTIVVDIWNFDFDKSYSKSKVDIVWKKTGSSQSETDSSLRRGVVVYHIWSKFDLVVLRVIFGSFVALTSFGKYDFQNVAHSASDSL